MKLQSSFLAILVCLLIHQVGFAKEYTKTKFKSESPNPTLVNCIRPIAKYDMAVNRIRAKLLTGGDLFAEAGYIFPAPEPNQVPVSALYSVGVWMGGIDRASNTKLSATTYRSQGYDYFSGPLDINGTTELDDCKDWDRIFTVNEISIKQFLDAWKSAHANEIPFNCGDIPDDIKYWPAQGNPYWSEKYNWPLPDQPLASYWDEDENGNYDPCAGDYPMTNDNYCSFGYHQGRRIPAEINYFVFNDQGSDHTLSGPSKMQMEFHCNAYAYTSKDDINDMTFYQYKLINKAQEDLLDCYFSWWIDPDLGCYNDDYVGIDTARNMVYVYNEDDIDGITNSSCEGVNSYDGNIPILGIDLVEGPSVVKIFLRNENGQLIYDANGQKILVDPPMGIGQVDTIVFGDISSFVTISNAGFTQSPTSDPQLGTENGFYNLMRGLWKDGTPMTYGGNGYLSSNQVTKYLFPGDPNDPTGWSMCNENLPFEDRRVLINTGPMLFSPGQTTNLTYSIFATFDVKYPCPDLSGLRYVNDQAQKLIEECIHSSPISPPDPPKMSVQQKDREIIISLFNDANSNNYEEKYTGFQYGLPANVDPYYRFEGYKIYQLRDSTVSDYYLDNPIYAKLVSQSDIKNDVSKAYNWDFTLNPTPTGNNTFIWQPNLMVEGQNDGLQTTLSITTDLFAEGTNNQLINGKSYYYKAVAYAYNNWSTFDITNQSGQQIQYLEGKSNLLPYIFSPKQTFNNGEPRLKVTRLSGEGNPKIFLDLEPNMYDKILAGNFDGKLVYQTGYGPIQAKITDPSKINQDIYQLKISGTFSYQKTDCAFEEDAIWTLTNITKGEILLENKPLHYVKEYTVENLGFALTIIQHDEPGYSTFLNNGAIGAKTKYTQENGPKWLQSVDRSGSINQKKNNELQCVISTLDDPNQYLSGLGEGIFKPFRAMKYGFDPEVPYYLSPAARDFMVILNNAVNNSLRSRDLNNVDIVFTSDKSKWSKCIVIETASPDYITNGYPTIGNVKNFEVRNTPSINNNGQPFSDGTFGFSYFPGYAVDVETGKRLNIFFGENSVFSSEHADLLQNGQPIGADLLFNPTSQVTSDSETPLKFVAGGQHYIYVTRQEYDGCKLLETKLKKGSSTLNKIKAAAGITWVAFPILPDGIQMKSIAEGLIPNDVTVQLRVDNPYGEGRIFDIDKEKDCTTDGEQPVYEFKFDEFISNTTSITAALTNVSVFPNPFSILSDGGNITITSLPKDASINIIDFTGSKVKTLSYKDGQSTSIIGPRGSQTTFNLGSLNLTKGIYFIAISDPNSTELSTLKWIVL